MQSVVLDIWQATSCADTGSWVIPDGCRDLIMRQVSGKAPRWFVSSVFQHSHYISQPPGSRLLGLRLAPSTVLNGHATFRLLEELNGCEYDLAMANAVLVDRLICNE